MEDKYRTTKDGQATELSIQPHPNFKPLYSFLAGAVLAGCIAVAVGYYHGKHQYNQGYREGIAKITEHHDNLCNAIAQLPHQPTPLAALMSEYCKP